MSFKDQIKNEKRRVSIIFRPVGEYSNHHTKSGLLGLLIWEFIYNFCSTSSSRMIEDQ